MDAVEFSLPLMLRVPVSSVGSRGCSLLLTLRVPCRWWVLAVAVCRSRCGFRIVGGFERLQVCRSRCGFRIVGGSERLQPGGQGLSFCGPRPGRLRHENWRGNSSPTARPADSVIARPSGFVTMTNPRPRVSSGLTAPSVRASAARLRFPLRTWPVTALWAVAVRRSSVLPVVPDARCGAQQPDGAAQRIDPRADTFQVSGGGAEQAFVEVVGPLHELAHLVARVDELCAQGVEPTSRARSMRVVQARPRRAPRACVLLGQCLAVRGEQFRGGGGCRAAQGTATSSAMVKSVSWPMAATVGIGQAAIARASGSELKTNRSSSEPPPRVSSTTSGCSAGMRCSAPRSCRSASGPCTATGISVTLRQGNRRATMLSTSRSAAPLRDDRIARWAGKRGSAFFLSLLNSPSAASRSFSALEGSP